MRWLHVSLYEMCYSNVLAERKCKTPVLLNTKWNAKMILYLIHSLMVLFYSTPDADPYSFQVTVNGPVCEINEF